MTEVEKPVGGDKKKERVRDGFLEPYSSPQAKIHKCAVWCSAVILLEPVTPVAADKYSNTQSFQVHMVAFTWRTQSHLSNTMY